jgi:mono/diheme cytochrome c family protein
MLRHVLLSAVIAIATLAPLPVHAANKPAFKSVNVDLPAGDRMFPERPGSEAANNNCLACHSAGMVLTQPALSKAQWRSEVEKMRNAYKAPIDPSDVDAIVDYLAGLAETK